MPRRPKPRAVLELTGAFRPKRHGTAAAIDIAGDVQPPDWLRGDALDFWDSSIAGLAVAGVVTAADVPAAAAACVAWSEWRRAAAALQNIAPTEPHYPRVCRAACALLTTWWRLAGPLGASPQTRESLRRMLPEPTSHDQPLLGAARFAIRDEHGNPLPGFEPRTGNRNR